MTQNKTIKNMKLTLDKKAKEINTKIKIIEELNTKIKNYESKIKSNEKDHIYIISTREGMKNIMSFLGKTDVEINSVMILGGGQIGSMVAEALSKTVDDVKIIDMDKERCIALAEKLPESVNIVNGDGRNSDLLVEESVKSYDAFIAVTGNDEANILASVVAKKFGINRVIAEVENIEYLRLAEEMGVDAVIKIPPSLQTLLSEV